MDLNDWRAETTESLLEELANALIPRIKNHLLRREVELAVATANRHLLRPDNAEYTEDAEAGQQRLRSTLERLDPNDEADVIRHAVEDDYAAAAAGAERLIGTSTVLHTMVTALRFERFDIDLAVQLLAAGRPPVDAVRAAGMVGRYPWWPSWLLDLARERAMAGRLDDGLIAAMDACGYAPLNNAQTHLARKLLSGDPVALASAAEQLDRRGEHAAAESLRGGDLTAVALAAKLLSF